MPRKKITESTEITKVKAEISANLNKLDHAEIAKHIKRLENLDGIEKRIIRSEKLTNNFIKNVEQDGESIYNIMKVLKMLSQELEDAEFIDSDSDSDSFFGSYREIYKRPDVDINAIKTMPIYSHAVEVLKLIQSFDKKE